MCKNVYILGFQSNWFPEALTSTSTRQDKLFLFTIDADDVYALAEKHGYVHDENLSPSDVINPEDCAKRKEISSVEEGVKLAQAHINSGKSWWGLEEIVRFKWDPSTRDWQRAEKWLVSSDGIDDRIDFEEMEGNDEQH
jgi:hypothetical protein